MQRRSDFQMKRPPPLCLRVHMSGESRCAPLRFESLFREGAVVDIVDMKSFPQIVVLEAAEKALREDVAKISRRSRKGRQKVEDIESTAARFLGSQWGRSSFDIRLFLVLLPSLSILRTTIVRVSFSK